MTRPPLRALAAPTWIALLAFLLLPAPPAGALEFGVRAGGYLDEKDPFVGLELLVPIGSRGLAFDPNVEFVFAERRDRVSINLDLRYEFLATSDYAVWGGAGLALLHVEGDRGRDDDDEAGANLLGGVDWRIGTVTPYALLKVVLADDSEVAAGVGIRF